MAMSGRVNAIFCWEIASACHVSRLAEHDICCWMMIHTWFLRARDSAYPRLDLALLTASKQMSRVGWAIASDKAIPERKTIGSDSEWIVVGRLVVLVRGCRQTDQKNE